MAITDTDDEPTGAIDTSSAPQAQQAQQAPDDNSGAAPVMGIPDDNSGAAPVLPAAQAAPGASEPQQGAPPPGSAGGANFNAGDVPGNMKKIISYLMGADAAHPNVIDQAAQHADPGGQMSAADRNLIAIDQVADKGGPQAAWPLVQANRVAYNAKTAFAKTALEGSQQKPADIKAAVDAANQAQSHVLDGSNIMFAQTQSGITATVKMPGTTQTQQINLTPQQFGQFLDVGGDGQWDKIMDSGAPATLQRLAQAQPQPSGGTGKMAVGMSAAQRRGGQPPAPAPQAPQASQDQEAETPAAPRARSNIGETPSTLNWSGTDAPLNPPDDKTDYGDELEQRAMRMFPGITQQTQRDQWMASQEDKDLDRTNRVDVAAEKGKNDIEKAHIAAGAHVQGAEATAKARVDAAGLYSGAKRDAALAGIAAKQQQLGQAAQNANSQRALKLIQTKIMAGQALAPNEDAFVQSLPGLAQPQAQRPAAQPQQQNAFLGAAPKPQASVNQPPVQGAKQFNGKWYTRGPNGESVPVQ
jgi:hypothetical protein